MAAANAQPKPDPSEEYSKRALALLTKYAIRPTPKNYTVWYEYAAGRSKELCGEIDALVKEGRPIGQDMHDYLYAHYIAGDTERRIFVEASIKAQQVLEKVLGAINEVSGEASGYGKDMERSVVQLAQQLEGDDGHLKEIVQHIIENTLKLRDKGENLGHKLDSYRQEISLLRTNLEQVAKESQKDFLTGLSNRKYFDQQIHDMAEQVKKGKIKGLCLLMVDIDHFKHYNDNYGHLLGDEVLKVVANAIVHCVRGRDTVARFGGEEFAVLLPETPLNGGLVVGENIRKLIASKELVRRDTGEKCGDVTVSIGVAAYNPDNDTAEKLIQRADEALYASKKAGRNRVSSREG